VIIFEHVTKRYLGGTVAVDDLSLEVPDGKTMILVGPSGCGKTTTLRMVNRLVEPTGGRILLDGRDVAQAARGEHDLRRPARVQDPSRRTGGAEGTLQGGVQGLRRTR